MEIDGLLREVMGVLQKAYARGRSDALCEIMAILGAETATKVQAQVSAPDLLLPHQQQEPMIRVRRCGRPDAMTEERKAAATVLLAEGRLPIRQIAVEVGVSPSRLYRWLREREKTE